ncbi:MAG: HAMP domain-containing histidine kinase [Lachnospiraceae bacterium]|nr:HAMP domain-containing histidine kinase [Lachnospiraceae bacterium]
MLAIKWKSNKTDNINEEHENLQLEKELERDLEDKRKPKQWLGFLLAGIFVLVLSLFSTEAGDYIQRQSEKLQKEWEEDRDEINKQTEKIVMDSLSDDEKMSIISNIYYLNYKMQHMYEGISVSEYMLADNPEYGNADGEEKKRYEEKAAEYMDILYSVYAYNYSVGNAHTHTYLEKNNGVSVGVTEISVVDDEKKREELYEKYQSFLLVEFDENGKVKVKGYQMDAGKFVNYLSNIKFQAVVENFSKQDIPIHSIELEEYVEEEDYVDAVPYEDNEEMDRLALEEDAGQNNEVITGQGKNQNRINLDFPVIRNVKVVIGFTSKSEIYGYPYHDNCVEMSYLMMLVSAMIIFLGALIIQNAAALGMRKHPLFQLPTELLTFFNSMVLIMISSGLPYVMTQVEKEGFEYFQDAGLAYAVAVSCWACIYAMIYWLIANCLPYILHPVKQLRERSILVKFFYYMKKKCKTAAAYIVHIDGTKGLQKNVLKAVIANFVVVSILCFGWFAGIFGVAIYSIVLYVLLMKKGSKLQHQYEMLLRMTKNMAEGKLNAEEEMAEDLGIFDSVKCELSKVRQGFRHAVEEEVKSQNMKTELITNVSHDLKTPLTAIITYVDLLKDETISEEARKEYIETLDKKSQRLKVLIEDLFEVSKASSNNITLHYADMDLCNLIKQVRLENEERIMDSDLVFRWNLPEEKCMLRLDPQKTYRIIENLLINALKYSMSGSRVYAELEEKAMEVVFTMKNISAMELNMASEKLTERFVRGDVSRNTEGSGLGLAIVRSFTEVQNGDFHIEIDGDLFKAVVVFYKSP